LPTNDVVTWSKPKERVTTTVSVTTESRKKGLSKTKKWGHPSLSRITHILLSHKSRLQTMEEESKEQLKRYIIDYIINNNTNNTL